MTETRPFHETHPHLIEFNAYLQELNKESPRGAVLVSATMIDELLKRSIKSYLLEVPEAEKLLEGFNAPLGSFSARILTAYLIGLIDQKMFRDCERIRKIRNEFAHNLNVTFDNERLVHFCQDLHFSAKDYGDVKLDARARFLTAATSIILNLTNRPHYAAQKRLDYNAWPS